MSSFRRFLAEHPLPFFVLQADYIRRFFLFCSLQADYIRRSFFFSRRIVSAASPYTIHHTPYTIHYTLFFCLSLLKALSRKGLGFSDKNDLEACLQGVFNDKARRR